MSVADEISPKTLGENRLDLTLDVPEGLDALEFVPRAHQLISVSVSYARADPDGLVLPLELVVVGPSGTATRQSRYFQRFAPSALTFRPREGGETLVVLRELFHNRWFGSLVFEVEGDELES